MKINLNESIIEKKIEEIINKLIIARNKQNITQSELAMKCGLKQSSIARMERLSVVPRIDTIMKVAQCLNVDIMVVNQVEFVNSDYNV